MEDNFDRDIGPYEGSREQELKAEELTQAKLSDVDVFREFIQDYLGHAEDDVLAKVHSAVVYKTKGFLLLRFVLKDMFKTFCTARAWEEVKEMDDLKSTTED